MFPHYYHCQQQQSYTGEPFALDSPLLDAAHYPPHMQRGSTASTATSASSSSSASHTHHSDSDHSHHHRQTSYIPSTGSPMPHLSLSSTSSSPTPGQRRSSSNPYLNDDSSDSTSECDEDDDRDIDPAQELVDLSTMSSQPALLRAVQSAPASAHPFQHEMLAPPTLPLHSQHVNASQHSSASSSPGQVQRVGKACEACRKKKRRCDGGYPTCSSCTRAMVECQYSTSVKKRGPQAGVVKELRAQVSALKLQLEKERHKAHRFQHPHTTTVTTPNASSVNAGAQLTAMLAATGGLDKAKLYCYHYFSLSNNLFFPMLEQDRFDACCAKYLPIMSDAPAVWHLTFAAVLAQGAAMTGDKEYAVQASSIARTSASTLFDQPSDEVIRGLLVLTFYTLASNELGRASCFLAVIGRMCTIVTMPPHIPLLAKWQEDMLCCVRTFWHGLEMMPEGSFQADQRQRFPQDWARYERCKRYYLNLKIGTTNTTTANPVDSGGLDFVGPPDPRDVDDSNIRWELFLTMVDLSSARGEFLSGAGSSVYHHLCVLTKAEHNPMVTSNAVLCMVALFKSQSLFYVNEIEEGVDYARLVTSTALQHDVTHNGFNALMFHFVSQVHLKCQEEFYIVRAVKVMEAIAKKWALGEAPLENIRLRILQLNKSSLTAALTLTTHPAIANFSQSSTVDYESFQSLNSNDRSRAESLYSKATSNLEHDQRLFNERVRASHQPVKSDDSGKLPPALVVRLPTLSETISKCDLRFTLSWRPDPTLIVQRPSDATLRFDHPHPHLSSLPAAPIVKLEPQDVSVSNEAYIVISDNGNAISDSNNASVSVSRSDSAIDLRMQSYNQSETKASTPHNHIHATDPTLTLAATHTQSTPIAVPVTRPMAVNKSVAMSALPSNGSTLSESEMPNFHRSPISNTSSVPSADAGFPNLGVSRVGSFLSVSSPYLPPFDRIESLQSTTSQFLLSSPSNGFRPMNGDFSRIPSIDRFPSLESSQFQLLDESSHSMPQSQMIAGTINFNNQSQPPQQTRSMAPPAPVFTMTYSNSSPLFTFQPPSSVHFPTPPLTGMAGYSNVAFPGLTPLFTPQPTPSRGNKQQ